MLSKLRPGSNVTRPKCLMTKIEPTLIAAKEPKIAIPPKRGIEVV